MPGSGLSRRDSTEPPTKAAYRYSFVTRKATRPRFAQGEVEIAGKPSLVVVTRTIREAS